MNDAKRFGRFMKEMFLIWNEIDACLWYLSESVKSDHLNFLGFAGKVINNLYYTVFNINILSHPSKYF